MLSLIGPGGVGKTRLAVAAAVELASCYADGVWFVDLAPVRESGLVAATIAHTLDLGESGGHSGRELLLERLRARRLLLVLDNLEHLPGTAPLMAELLAACPYLAFLVTSRAALRVRWEQRFRVAPLATPPEDEQCLAVLAATPAVQLFVERANQVAPEFELTAGSGAAVGAICRRLDGMPLALELAAARVSLLTPTALLRRLERRLPLLTGGAIDLPERQRALRQTLAWSHDLLGPVEQTLFRRLAVFAGGWTLEAAEAVCGDADLAPEDVLERLERLVDTSLAYSTLAIAGDPRFGMLETVREFAEEQLEGSGEWATTRQRHLDWHLAFAENEPLEQISPRHVAALTREHDNLRAAFDWSLGAGRAEDCLRLAIGMAPLWYLGGRYAEGRSRLANVLALDAGARPSRAHSEALSLDGYLASCQGDFETAEARLADGLAMARASGDEQATIVAWHLLGQVTMIRGDLAESKRRHEQALAIERRQSLRTWQGVTLSNLAMIAQQQGRAARAGTLAQEAAVLLRAANHAWGLARVLQTLAALARADHDDATAVRLLDDALGLLRDLGDQQGVVRVLLSRAQLAQTRGAPARAVAAYAEGLAIVKSAGARVHMVPCLEGLATLLAEPCPEQAVQLAATTAAARERLSLTSFADEQARLQEALVAARACLGERQWALSWAVGEAWTLEQAAIHAQRLVDEHFPDRRASR